MGAEMNTKRRAEKLIAVTVLVAAVISVIQCKCISIYICISYATVYRQRQKRPNFQISVEKLFSIPELPEYCMYCTGMKVAGKFLIPLETLCHWQQGI